MSIRILKGDCRELLKTLPAQSVHTCVTSPPYWGLRDYGHPGQLGMEATPEAYCVNMIEVFREVKRVLRDDGTLWLNLGDSYASQGKDRNEAQATAKSTLHTAAKFVLKQQNKICAGLKPKDLVGIPWMMAFALRADGWYLRSDIIWAKPNPMPESVTDRPTKAHEYIFLLSKSERYYYDAEAIMEPVAESTQSDARLHDPDYDTGRPERGYTGQPQRGAGLLKPKKSGNKERKHGEAVGLPEGVLGRSIPGEGYTRNKRTVWTVSTKPFSGAHFATFPPDLIEPCIKAGAPEGGTVLDPFGGAGTTGLVADRLGRNAVLCEINPDYIKLADHRLTDDAPLFTEVKADV